MFIRVISLPATVRREKFLCFQKLFRADFADIRIFVTCCQNKFSKHGLFFYSANEAQDAKTTLLDDVEC